MCECKTEGSDMVSRRKEKNTDKNNKKDRMKKKRRLNERSIQPTLTYKDPAEEEEFDSFYNMTSSGRFFLENEPPQIRPEIGELTESDLHAADDEYSGDYDGYYNYTSVQRFSNFIDPPQIKHNPDDYFRSRYGYVANSQKERERDRKNDKRKNKNRRRQREQEQYSPAPRSKPKELTRSQRKRRARISYILTFFLMIGIAGLLSFNVIFRTNEIVVENAERVPYSEGEIIAQSGLKLKGNIFTVRKKAAVKSIVDNLPYIENAEITYKIPGTRIIRIEPAVPSYEVAVNGGYAIISEKGRVLEINPNQLSTIPLLKGLKVTDTEVGKYISFEKETTKQILEEVIANINENNVPYIYGIDISNAASIKLNYDNRITIHIGLPENVGYKLRTAMAIINNQLTAADKGDLDVSLSSGDKKVSYFTPIYSNTVSAESRVTSSQTASSEHENDNYDDYTVSNQGVRKATTSEESGSSSGGEESTGEDNDDEYYYDEYQEDGYYYSEENPDGNITGEYGTNYDE